MTRIHVALDVQDLHQAVEFYQAFLGVSPFRIVGHYAQFLDDAPALNLALTERTHPRPAAGHFGLEVESLSEVNKALSRVRAHGLSTAVEADSHCCYARQEKFWVTDPDGYRWEVFWVRERRHIGDKSDGEEKGYCDVG